MDKLSIPNEWKFKDFKQSIEDIKAEFEGIISSFSMFTVKQDTKQLHYLKEQIFNHENIQYWQRERTWEVLNGDFEIEKYKRLGG